MANVEIPRSQHEVSFVYHDARKQALKVKLPLTAAL